MQQVPVRDCQDGSVQADTPHYGNHFAKTANYTLVKGDSGKIFSNKGAGGAVTFTLPAAVVGRQYTFAKVAAQNLTIQASGGATINNSAANGTFANTTAGDAGKAIVEVMCPDGVNWYVIGATGTWATT
jgi:hypothetical protein